MGDSEGSQRLIKARGEVSHEDVAGALGVPASRVEHWENTGIVPKRWRARLAKHYGVNAEALFVTPLDQALEGTSPEADVSVADVSVTITEQPEQPKGDDSALLLKPGDSKKLSVVAVAEPSTLTLSYSWFQDGKPLKHATKNHITVEAGPTGSDEESGDYYVVVTAGEGEDKASIQSAVAKVRLQLPQPELSAESRQTARAIDVTVSPGSSAPGLGALIDHYVVDLDPRPPTFGLPRRVPPPKDGTLKVTIPDVPLVDEYKVLAHAVSKKHKTPGVKASKTVTFATGKRPTVTKVGVGWASAAVVALVLGGLFTWTSTTVETWALRMAAAGIVFIVSLVFAFGWHRSALVGADGRVSTSKFQTAVSTLAVGYALLVVMGMTFGAAQFCDQKSKGHGCDVKVTVGSGDKAKDVRVDEATFGDLVDTGLSDDYLLMLGGPFAALVLSRLSVGRKVQDGTVQKVAAAAPKVSDAVSDDSGRASLIDCQYLLLASLTVFYLIWQVTTQPEKGLPALPQTLVLLSSAAVLAYLGDKAIEDSKLRITAISAVEAAPGDLIEVRGQNLVPAGAVQFADGGIVLRLGAYALQPETVATDLVAFEVPKDVPAGAHAVTVTSAAGQQETAGTLTVQRAPRLDGLSTPVAREGDTLLVYGERLVGFRSPRSSPTVLFGSTATFGRHVDTQGGRALEVTVPALGIAADAELDVQVAVQPSGEQPSPDRLPLKVKPKV